MRQRQTIHFVERETRTRAQLARVQETALRAGTQSNARLQHA